MSLFDAPKGSVLVHACNAKGVMGSGIALEFKKRFPENFKEYHEYCTEVGDVTGSAFVWSENDYLVGNLITSSTFSPPDEPLDIIISTTMAIEDLLRSTAWDTTIYSNKFNSRLFNVPWEHTEKVIKRFTNLYNIKWIVCDPNIEE